MADDKAPHEDKVVVILTRPALDRLLGGDSELEIRLRHATAKAFSEKYLYTMLNDKVRANILARLNTAMSAFVNEAIGGLTQTGYRTTVKINPDIEKRVRDTATQIADAAISKHLATVSSELTGRCERMLTDISNTIVRSIEQAVQTRLAQLTEERIESEIQRRLAVAASVPGAQR